MGFFDKVKAGLGDLTDEAQKLMHKTFLQAMTGAGALTAAADGSIDPCEKQKMVSFIKANPDLEVFSEREILTSFDAWVTQIQTDVDSARSNMFAAIGKLKNNENAARILMRQVVAIAEADGNFDDDEKAIAREIAQELGLSADEFIK